MDFPRCLASTIGIGIEIGVHCRRTLERTIDYLARVSAPLSYVMR
ncbi:MAG: hypothetical protein AVDCRST_MAG33-2107 [uncultured Thermomicrobiales bacterium]|uniref:Uncharacterized protein n=1 Tax=uncultured Thermomicrobiales bacterium TaxID=1645740 RepID=A0A6J4V151_9BACT|nr:MAG: hypothetical protein AVDCRST_MAG33-2107 [uncultured Thermomicrobiales bacterium]